MFVVDVQKNQAKVTENEPMTSGSANVYVVQFKFSDEWSEMMRTAVFQNNKGTTANVLLDDTNRCMIPWELMTDPCNIDVGVYGTMGENVVLPTIWAPTGVVVQGVELGDDALDPDPSIYQQVLNRLDQLENGGSGEPLDVYSTEETRVGTWIDGKPLYRITARVTSPSTKDRYVSTGVVIQNLREITRMYGTLNVDGEITVCLPFFETVDGYVTLSYRGGIEGFCMRQHHPATALSGKPCVISIEYTKTTDEPEVTA